MIRKNILQKLKEYKLGLTRKTLSFSDTNDRFFDCYTFISHMIKISVSNIETHHIGSTAVPGLIAKPVLDILLVYHNRKDFLRQSIKLEDLGFTFKGEDEKVKDGLLFDYYNDDQTISYVHIHAFKSGHKTIDALLNFRNKLLSSAQLTEAYAKLKLDLKTSGISRKEYPNAKTDWILSVLAN